MLSGEPNKKGKMIKDIPKEVLLSCIQYRVTEVEGMIVFSENNGMYGCCDRMIFTKGQYSSWRLQLKTTFNTIQVSHIIEAYKLIKEWRGND
jgi:hypothetical protein